MQSETNRHRTDQHILHVVGVTKSFGGIKAVDNVSISVEYGTVAGIIGPNGSGKTTFFNLITGIYRPDSGEIYLVGRSVNRFAPNEIAQTGVARTFQNPRIFRKMTVLENMLVPTKEFRFSQLFGRGGLLQQTERAAKLLGFVKLEGFRDELAGNLSFGQQKLLEFAASLMSDPKLMLLDEPTSGVNPSMIVEMMNYVKEMNKAGITFVIIEHNMSVTMNLCQQITAFDHGQKIAEGSPAEIKGNRMVMDAYLGG